MILSVRPNDSLYKQVIACQAITCLWFFSCFHSRPAFPACKRLTFKGVGGPPKHRSRSVHENNLIVLEFSPPFLRKSYRRLKGHLASLTVERNNRASQSKRLELKLGRRPGQSSPLTLWINRVCAYTLFRDRTPCGLYLTRPTRKTCQ